jgi:hypothetical protein
MTRGLGYLGISQEECAKMSAYEKAEDFRAHYGSSLLVIANMWYDFHNTTIPEAQLEAKDKKEKGFLCFMIGHFFLALDAPEECPHLMKTRFKIGK